MEQLEKIAKKYNLRYENWSDLVGYETGEILFGQNDSGYWHPWLTRTAQSISISTEPLIRLTNSNPDITMESAIKFVAGINKWSKQYDYIFPLQTLIPFYEWNKIKKNSRNNLKVELGDITLSKKLVKQMEDFEYREEIIRCISDYKICRWGNTDEKKRQDNDCNFCLENEIRDSFETSRGILKIKTESNRSSTYIRLL